MPRTVTFPAVVVLMLMALLYFTNVTTCSAIADAFDAPLISREDRVKHFMRQNARTIDQYGKEIGEAIREIMEKYKSSGEENLSAQAFLLPNMNAKKEAIQQKYPDGLFGFVHTLKCSVREPSIRIWTR